MTKRPVGVPPRGLALLVAVVVALAVVTTFVVIKARDMSDASSRNTERTQVAAIAGQYAVDFSSIDYSKFDAETADAVTHATADFAKKYLATMKVFKPLYTKGKVVQTTSVARTAVETVSASAAKVLVAVSGTATNVNTTAPTQQLYRFEISLSKVDGKWLTSDVTTL
jgi:Mce-associated membrane protein